MTEINPINFKGAKVKELHIMPTAEEIMKEQIKKLASKLHARAEREVPEYGDFAVVYEELKNLDKNLPASDFMLKIYKPKGAKDEKLRCVEAVAYALPTPYKIELPLLQGNKDEILKAMQDKEFRASLPDVFKELANNLSNN